jgi:hypothetical protein
MFTHWVNLDHRLVHQDLRFRTEPAGLKMKDKIGMGIAASNGLLLTGIASMSLYRLPIGTQGALTYSYKAQKNSKN